MKKCLSLDICLWTIFNDLRCIFSLVIIISTEIMVHSFSHTSFLEVELTLANFIKICNLVKYMAYTSSKSLLWACRSKGLWNLKFIGFTINSVQFSRSVMSDSLWPHILQYTRPPCPSPTPRVYSNSCPWSQWCHPTISSSIVPFSSCLQSFPAAGSFPMSQLFAWGGQSIGVSASTSVLPMNIQDSFPLGLTGWISSQSKGLSRVFSNATVQKHQFLSTQLPL